MSQTITTMQGAKEQRCPQQLHCIHRVFSTSEICQCDPSQSIYVKSFDFAPPYDKHPLIAMVLNEFDIAQDGGVRVQCFPDMLKADGMRVHIISWAETRLFTGACNWMQFDRDDVFQTGTFKSTDVRDWRNPQVEDILYVEFEVPFPDAPHVVCFLNFIDCDKSRGVRIEVFASDITYRGFKAHIKTWSDTILYCGGLTWVAYPDDELPSGLRIQSGYLNNTGTRFGGEFDFGPGVFTQPPQVMLGLSHVDLGPNSGQGTRLRASVEDGSLTSNGFNWQASAWDNTTQYGVSISFLAVGTSA